MKRLAISFGDEETRNLIWSLYREKDEARTNYAEETKKTSRLEVQLTVAEDMALTARAQLVATDARVAGQFFIVTEKSISDTALISF